MSARTSATAKAPRPSSARKRIAGKRSPVKKRQSLAKGGSAKGSTISDGTSGFLLKFRQADSSYGVTRGTVKAVSDALGLTETQVVHIALARLAHEVLPAYDLDGGPLTPSQLAALRQDAKDRLAKGEVLSKQSLFG
jgi:hypothetical protein